MSNAPPRADRRPRLRNRVLLGGVISFRDGAQSFDCTIRDLSEGGARIALPRNQPMPSHVFLINMRDRLAYEAHVAWNNGTEAGLLFAKSLPLADLADPQLVYLKKLWHDRAMR